MWETLAGFIIINTILFFTVMVLLVKFWFITIPVGTAIWLWAVIPPETAKGAVLKVHRTVVHAAHRSN